MLKELIKRATGQSAIPIKKLDDEFLTWLSFANAGMLHPGNPYCFDYAINRLPTDNPIIEIGSFCGLSTNVMAHLLKKHDKTNKIITSDRWIFEGAENGGPVGNSNIQHSDYRDFVIDTFKRNLNFFAKPVAIHPIEVFSDDFFKLWDNDEVVSDIMRVDIQLGGNISFAYIDGNHTYEYAKRDFQNVSKYLDTGGFILFDDSSDNTHFGCAELMKEIVDDPHFELVIKNPNYLFKKIS